MWEEGVCIYSTLEVPNNYPLDRDMNMSYWAYNRRNLLLNNFNN